MRFLNRSYSMYKKMILYISVLIAVVLFVQSLILNRNFEKIGSRMTFDSNVNMLSQISYSANYMNDAVRSFAATIYSDPNNLPLRYAPSANPEEIYGQLQIIDTMVNQSPYIYSVYIYNGEQDRFYSSKTGTIVDADHFPDQDLAQLIEQNLLPADYQFSPIPRQIPLNSYNGANRLATNVLTYLICDRYSDSGRIQSAIVINVKVDYLTGLIKELKNKGSSLSNDVAIVTGGGLISDGLHADAEQAGPLGKASMQRVAGSTEKSGYFKAGSGKDSKLITYVSSDILDWKFVSATPFQEIVKDINKIRLVTYFACVVIAAIGLVLAYFLSKHLYSPLRRVIGTVGSAVNADPAGEQISEIEFLSRVFMDNIESAKSLKIAKNENDYRLKQQELRHLLTDRSLSPEQIEKTFLRLHVGLLPRSPLFVCHFAIDDLDAFQRRFSLRDQELFRYMVGNVSGEMIDGQFRHEFVVLGDRQLILISQSRSDDAVSAYSQVPGLMRCIQEWFAEKTGLSLTVAIGYLVPDVSEIHSAYNNAVELSKYRFIYGHRSILTPEAADAVSAEAFERPISLERQLDESLSAGKLDDCIRHYSDIVRHISRYSYDDVASYLLYFCYLIYMKVNDLESKGYDKLPLEIQPFTQEIVACETLEQVNVKFMEMFASIAEVVKQKKFKRKNALAEKIIHILETDYRNKGLCQEGVASDLNVSKDYVGRIFKETYAQSFGEYLNEIRLNRAAQLLSTTKKNIAEIAEEIGWENKNYLYTLFKAKFGMTTSEYRTKYGL
ncbi:AraC family transcriptional regulator [Cohnella hashimotonis]|uniref:AraC family transcriptional regulator n=1 Tax=Cohnella hashimotonis TaxID=2826895 RepID=A0ABT6TDS2_9BACL|nr:AraC family transcriptional regulator [Cohnella hashimotonis]MDI4644483.1 AraC family transcriptional regulator [Cohnella hashimotonis]